MEAEAGWAVSYVSRGFSSQQERLTHARTPPPSSQLQPTSKHLKVLWNAAPPSRWGETGPNEPQTAAGRWGASASDQRLSLALLLSLSASPSFLLPVCHFSDSSAVAKTAACYRSSDQHRPQQLHL